jgi:hypothetical protein
MRAHGLLAADHHRLIEVWIDNFALVEHQLGPLPTCVIVLIAAGNAIHENGLPSFGEALLFFARPFDPRLYRQRVLLSFLPPFDVGMGSGASFSSRSACFSSSSLAWVPSLNPLF